MSQLSYYALQVKHDAFIQEDIQKGSQTKEERTFCQSRVSNHNVSPLTPQTPNKDQTRPNTLQGRHAIQQSKHQ